MLLHAVPGGSVARRETADQATPPRSGIAGRQARAVAIRDHVLPLVLAHADSRQYGCLGKAGPLHLLTWARGPFRLVLRLPFHLPGAASPAGRGAAPPPNGLDIVRLADDARVFSIAWELDGRLELVAFRRGTWEDEALALS